MAVAAVAMIYNAVTNNHQEAGESASDALAAGLGALGADDGDLVAPPASRSSRCLRRQQLGASARRRPRRRGGRDHAHDPDPSPHAAPMTQKGAPDAG